MIKHLMAVAALAGCSMVASAAYAGSPYYADPGETYASPSHATRPTASHALGTSHTGQAWANSGYAATANDDSFGSAATPAAPAVAAPATVVTPQYGTVQAVPQYFYHAEGTMGAR